LSHRPPAFRPRSTLHSSKGFTIVEVMMAATLLVVGFIGLLDAVGLSSNMMDHAKRQTLASQIINHELEKLRLSDWPAVSGLPTAATALAIDREFWPPWNSRTSYVANNVVSYNGAWYRCILANGNQVPPNASYWTATTTAQTTDIVYSAGATFTAERTVTVTNPVTNIREVNVTVRWVVKTGRLDLGGSQVNFTYVRTNSGWFGKYGLNFSYQRS
jgi:Tfp pilus assembly protein PilV